MIPGAKPLAYYRDQHGVHPIFGWQKITNPPTGWFASKTTGWTADSFSGGMEVDFSSVVSIGTKAIRVVVNQAGVQGMVFWRKADDANISNTPQASAEYSHIVLNSEDDMGVVVLWLNLDYKVQFAVSTIDVDLLIAYPVEYLIT